MITALFFGCLGIAAIYVFVTGKHTLGLLLVFGFTQDSIRKLTPGEPIIFVVTVGIVFGAVLLGIWARKGFAESLEPFVRYTRKIQIPILVFLFILVLQFIYSLVSYGNVIVGFIGLTTYLAPFLAVIVGYYLANDVEDIRRFMYLYIAAGGLVAVSVLASFMGLDWAIFKEVGSGLKIYDQGTVLKSYSGIMRTGEVAAWHISTAACLIIALVVTSSKPRNFFIVTAIVGLLMLAVALTGRRKMLMLVTLFIVIYFLVYLYYRKTLETKYFFTVIATLLIAWVVLETISMENYSDSLRNYIVRSSTVFGDASGRFVELGIT
ncbi:MAG: hypothetical protein HKN85_09315, partial [Gammaproteobacteria bacterium]|nr:hypothetical protein [Gammaproteobacteria bacterium]